MYIIGVYDINTETYKGQRILNKTFKLFKRFLNHIQNSVFEGELTNAQFEKLKYETKLLIRPKLDSIIFFKSREQRWLDKEVIGIEKNKLEQFI